MIKMLKAHTFEADDIEAAVSEILEQLDLENNLLENSVGLINCFADFISTGVVKALCDALPFHVIGTTSNSFSDNDAIDNILLTISVITSDELKFSCELSESIFDIQRENIISTYEKAASRLQNKPSLMLTYNPLIRHVGGDTIIDVLNEVSGNIPNFGTMVVDHTMDYHDAQVIFDGEGYANNLAIILIEGNIEPVFLQTFIPENKIQKQKAIVTKSTNNILKEINNMPVVGFLKNAGLFDDISRAANVVPFVIDFNNGTPPVARSIYFIDDNGYAVCGGEIPEGSTLALGFVEIDDIVSSAKDAALKILETGKTNGAIIFSCLARHLTLELDEYAEMEAIQKILGDNITYSFCYSGGELCPVYDKENKLRNRFHNDTLIACVF